jgi:hypothetical protein
MGDQPAICIRPGCGRNFTEHIHASHLMEWCPRCTNLDGTMTDSCYCREEYAPERTRCGRRFTAARTTPITVSERLDDEDAR